MRNKIVACVSVLLILAPVFCGAISAEDTVHIKGEIVNTQIISIGQADLEAYCSSCRCDTDTYPPPCCIDYEAENAGTCLVLEVKIDEIQKPPVGCLPLASGDLGTFYLQNTSLSVNKGDSVEIDIENPICAGFYSCVGGVIVPDKVEWDVMYNWAFEIIDITQS